MEKTSKFKSILITGGSGQVGSDLNDVKKTHNFKYHFPSSNVLNITQTDSIRNFLDNNNTDLILNLAAYTNVDKSENDRKTSKNVNNIGASLLSKIAKDYGIGIIHFSTDYVFGGPPHKLRRVNDKVSPVNYYGLTKSKGEEAVLRNNKLGFIVRLASVYSIYGDNFVKKIMKLIIDENEVKVVSDQKISVISSLDLAKNIPYLIELYKKNINIPDNNILHLTNKGYTTWFKMAKVIKDEMRNILGNKINTKIIPIKSTEWNSIAKRPLDSRLKVDFRKLERENIKLLQWDESLRSIVKAILSKGLN